MRKTLSIYIFLACVIIIQAGCGSARRGEPLAGPIDISSQVLARGQEVFTRQCSQCHPGGEAGLGPSLNNKPLPGFMMKFQVRHGLGAMPAFPKEVISDDDLDAVVEYIKTLRHHGKAGNE